MRPAVAICWHSTGASIEVCPGRVTDSFELHTNGIFIPLIVRADGGGGEDKILAEKYKPRRFDLPGNGTYRIELEIIESSEQLARRIIRIGLNDTTVTIVYEDRYGPVRQRVRWRALNDKDYLAAEMPSAWEQIGEGDDDV